MRPRPRCEDATHSWQLCTETAMSTCWCGEYPTQATRLAWSLDALHSERTRTYINVDISLGIVSVLLFSWKLCFTFVVVSFIPQIQLALTIYLQHQLCGMNIWKYYTFDMFSMFICWLLLQQNFLISAVLFPAAATRLWLLWSASKKSMMLGKSLQLQLRVQTLKGPNRNFQALG